MSDDVEVPEDGPRGIVASGISVPALHIDSDPRGVAKSLADQLANKSIEAATNWDAFQQASQKYGEAMERVMQLEMELSAARAEVAVLRSDAERPQITERDGE